MADLPPELDFSTPEGRIATPDRMNRFAGYILARLRALESQQPEFQAAVEQLLTIGLDRVNESLVPVFNQANEIADDLTALHELWTANDVTAQVAAAVLLTVYSQDQADAIFAPLAHAHAIAGVTGLQAALDALAAADAALAAQKGTANGIASLDAGGKVPAIQLPSYVDDVVEAADFAALPAVGEAGKIYVTADNGKTFRWSGSGYAEISAAPGSTDAVVEGAANKYFTEARVRAALATGLADTAGTPAAADSILTILGKIRRALFTDFNESVDDRVAALLAGAGTVSLSYDDTSNVLTITGSDGWTYVRPAADTLIESSNNTTTGLSVPGANFAAGSWEVEAFAIVERTQGSQDITLNLLAPTGASIASNNWWFASMPGEGLVTLSNLALSSGGNSGFATLTTLATGNIRGVMLRGFFHCTAVLAGTLDIRARNASTNDDLTVKKGSWLRYRKVA